MPKEEKPALTLADCELRDLFAAFALAGRLTYSVAPEPKETAKYCYAYADAMLAERERKP